MRWDSRIQYIFCMVTSILKYDGKLLEIFYFFLYIFVSQICNEKVQKVQKLTNFYGLQLFWILLWNKNITCIVCLIQRKIYVLQVVLWTIIKQIIHAFKDK